jgi:hypothetical protein
MSNMKPSRAHALCAAVIAFAAAGCGSESESRPVSQAPQGDAVAAKLRDCQTAGRDARGELLVCQERSPNNHGKFLIDDGSSRELLDIQSPGPTPTASAAGRVGHWAWAALSPDGSTLLAQWSAECEVPIAFFAPAAGGEPRVVSGEDDWAESPTSIALGWTTDGRAIVLFPDVSPCGSVDRAGLYLIATDGTHTWLRGVDRFAEKLEPSVKPRSAESLEDG